MTLEPLLRDHPFLKDLEPEHQALLAGCAMNVRFGAGSFLFREGDAAGQCFLIREGKISLEIAAPGQQGLVLRLQVLEERVIAQ